MVRSLVLLTAFVKSAAMSIVEILVLIALLSVVASLPYWLNRGPKRVRFAGVSDEQRVQLGDALAGLLVATRSLRSELVAFEHCVREMLIGELAERLPSGHRPYGRELADVNFLDDIRKLRRAMQAWLEQVAAIPEADRQRFGIEADALTELLEQMGAYERSINERVNDRSADLRSILDQCGVVGRALAQVDAALSAPPDSPYR